MSGPAPGTGCNICESPDRAAINSEIAAGVLSSRAIDRKYGLTRGTTGRHKAKFHPGVVVVSGEPGESKGAVGDDAPEIEKLKVIRAQLEAAMLHNPRAETSRELRQVNQRIAEIQGLDKPKRLDVADVKGLPEQIKRWFEALEPYPEAREAMMRATDPKLLEASGASEGAE